MRRFLGKRNKILAQQAAIKNAEVNLADSIAPPAEEFKTTDKKKASKKKASKKTPKKDQ